MPTFESLVTASSSAAAYLANGLYQVAYVVPDLRTAVALFGETLGANRFLVLDNAEVRNQEYRGKPTAIRQDIAFGYAGNLQIEIIQPLTGPSTYTELLDVRPQGGMHHVGVWVEDFAKARLDLEASGYEMVQYGEFAESTHFAYFDTAVSLGSLLEVFNWDEQTQAMFADIREQRFDQDS